MVRRGATYDQDTDQLQDILRQRLALNLGDPGEIEGASLSATYDTVQRALTFAQFDRAGAGALTALGGAASKRLAGAGDLSETVTLTYPPSATTLWRFQLPADYDQSVPTPLVIWLHNNSGTATNGSTDARMQPLYFGLRDAGYIIASASVGPSWANDTGRAEVEAMYLRVRASYNISCVVLVGVSMGGAFALGILPRLEIPNVVAYLGIGAVASLQNLYTAGYKSQIDAAFGVSTFAAIPDEFKPELRGGWEFRGVPMMLVHSPDDATCDITNSANLVDRVALFAPGSQLVESTGAHLAVDQFDDAVTYGIPWVAGLAPVGDTTVGPGPDPEPTDTGALLLASHRWSMHNLTPGSAPVSLVDTIASLAMENPNTGQRPLAVEYGTTQKMIALVGDGSDDYLETQSTFARSATESEAFIVKATGTLASARRYFTSTRNGGGTRTAGAVNTTFDNFITSDGTALSPSPVVDPGDGDFHVVIIVRNGDGTGVISIDGVETTGSIGAAAAKEGYRWLSSGSASPVSASATPAAIAWVYLWDGVALTAPQRADVYAQLATRLPS